MLAGELGAVDWVQIRGVRWPKEQEVAGLQGGLETAELGHSTKG